MEFDPTTFTLEVLNFLVLVWLLEHFFYKPVLEVIEKRKSATDKTIMDAKDIQKEAEDLKNEYQLHLAEFDKEHAKAKALIDEEIVSERRKRLESLESEIALERKRRKAIEDREHSELQNALEKQALKLGSRFASHLLERISGLELNAKLIEMAVVELGVLGANEKEALRSALKDPGLITEVISAYPLDELQRTSITNTLIKLAGHSLNLDFSEDSSLKAGVYIKIGSWVLSANVRDELSFFGRNFGHES